MQSEFTSLICGYGITARDVKRKVTGLMPPNLDKYRAPMSGSTVPSSHTRKHPRKDQPTKDIRTIISREKKVKNGGIQ